MARYALAIDLGASSGRHILGWLEDGRVRLEEVYRFPNGYTQRGGHMCWDIEALEGHVLEGMRRCAKLGRAPATVGIDTWGVDYVWLDHQGRRLGEAVAYRDARTEGWCERLDARMDARALYGRTGMARNAFNTVYQLMAELDGCPERAEQAAQALFMPCYLSYCLTGVARNEYTIASTSGLLNACTRDWDVAVLAAAGIPARLLGGKPAMPGERLGALRPQVAAKVGYTCEVVLPCAHDTGSAYLAVPDEGGDAAYLSSGTWSLLGMALDEPVLGEEAMRAGFTNEGGFGGRIRFLRNIMGLWMLQCLRREWGERYSFVQMAELAKAGSGYRAVFDAADGRFLSPDNMEAEIKAALREGGERAPDGDAELLYCVHHSLAACYRDGVRSLETLTGRRVGRLHIVGGGCQNLTLNQLTADETGLEVCAGPVEATALGNLIAQWIAAGDVRDEAEARRLLRCSMETRVFVPGGAQG